MLTYRDYLIMKMTMAGTPTYVAVEAVSSVALSHMNDRESWFNSHETKNFEEWERLTSGGIDNA